MHDVITIGSATLDVFLCCLNLDVIEKDGKKEIAFPYGAKINVDNVLFETGGGATNTATTFARQGIKVAVLAKIGNDFPAEKVISKLENEHINTQHIVKDEADTTDFATIVWAPNKGSVILVNRGKGRLEDSDIDWDSLSARWFHISSVSGNIEIVKKVKDRCDRLETNAKIAWNPGKKELVKNEDVLSILPCVELLILNQEEARLLFGRVITAQNHEDRAHIESIFKNTKLLLTDGHNGSYYYDGKDWFHAGIYPVDRKEATGAGDAFGSAFVAGIIRGLNEHDCLKLASANAASVVTAPSAKKGILTREEARKWSEKELEIKKL